MTSAWTEKVPCVSVSCRCPLFSISYDVDVIEPDLCNRLGVSGQFFRVPAGASRNGLAAGSLSVAHQAPDDSGLDQLHRDAWHSSLNAPPGGFHVVAARDACVVAAELLRKLIEMFHLCVDRHTLQVCFIRESLL